VEPGGGAFTVVPGSHHKTYAAAAAMRTDEDLEQLKSNPVGVAKIDLSAAIEICPKEGDLLIFNPMCLHSASRNMRSAPRYVYFASFMDAGAAYLQRSLHRVKYKRPLGDDLARRIQTEYPKLYEW
jgi:ectoine hydroxylase-related dioxygenase (phytanoyl-CoA dioxygenase family)